MSRNDCRTENLREFLTKVLQSKVENGEPPEVAIETSNQPVIELNNYAEKHDLEKPNFSRGEVMSVLWDMVMERIVEPRWLDNKIRRFQLTEYGGKLLAGLPIDRPNQYIDYLEDRVKNISPVVITYLRESLKSYNLGCYFASSVMLGVASEWLFEHLVDVYSEAIQNGNARQQFQKRIADKGISAKYSEFKKKLPDLTGGNGLTAEDKPSTRRLREDFKQAIEITFDTIRSYRDYAAHPRDEGLPRHVVKFNLDAFPLFCQRVYQAIEWLESNPVEAVIQ